MANDEIKWENLTPTEAATLATLRKSGKKICAAPVEIEHRGQLETLGITWEQMRTWHIGSEPVKVHLTPADEDTAKYLLSELRARHRDEYRARRCMIPGKRNHLIRCPEDNRCAKCPHPKSRDQHEANVLSWDALIGDGYEEISTKSGIGAVEAKMSLEAVFNALDAKNPKYKQAFLMKEFCEMSVAEIAEAMHDTKRNIYYYLAEAKKIGGQYKHDKQ